MPGLNFSYNYDGLGNRLSASEGAPALVTEYEPDAMNRYTSITSPGGDDILVKSDTPVDVEVDEVPVDVLTSGDFRSARITATNTTAPAFPEISITGDNNFSETGHRWIPQATFSLTYDDDGNLTNDGRWIYTWDAMNRLTGMTPTTAALAAGVPNQTLSFAYDHRSRRIAKKVTTTKGETTTVNDYRYLYEGWNVVAQFTADTSNDLTPDATYLWSLDLSGSFHGAGGVGGLHSVNLFPLPLGEGQGGGAKLCLACYDANGNIIAWTDSTGRVLQRQDYDPFGNRVIRERLAITQDQSERLEYGFSTKPLDAETGLIYYIHRYYGPRHGRWLSEDPIGVNGGLNLYGYCQNNGLSLVDPLGLDYKLKIVGPAKAVENDPATRSAAVFLTGSPENWKADGVRRKDFSMPTNIADINKSHKKLTLFTITSNARYSKNILPETHKPIDPADPAKGIYSNSVGNLGFNVYLTQQVDITIDAASGVISAKEARQNEWKWYGAGPGHLDYIAVGSILVINQPEQKNKATFDYYGAGGIRFRQKTTKEEPPRQFYFSDGSLEGLPHATEENKELMATGTGFFGNGVPAGKYPEVTYTPFPPYDGHRHPDGSVDGRKEGKLGKVSLSVECVKE